MSIIEGWDCPHDYIAEHEAQAREDDEYERGADRYEAEQDHLDDIAIDYEP